MSFAAAVRSALQGQDTTYIRNASQELNEAVQKMGASAYQQAEPEQAQAGDEGAQQETDEGTVEGEFREV